MTQQSLNDAKADEVFGTPLSSHATSVAAIDDFDLAELLSLVTCQAFTQLGHSNFPIDTEHIQWMKPPAEVDVPLWYTWLMEFMQKLLLLRWASSHQDSKTDPAETAKIQPVLKAVLSLVGKKFGFTVTDGNSTKLVLRQTQKGIFPAETFVGATDLIVKWDGAWAMLVEVKVTFGARKYLAQALAEGYAAVAGLNTKDWSLESAFESSGLPAVPRVILWNGPLLSRIHVDSINSSQADPLPLPVEQSLWSELVHIQSLKAQPEAPWW